MCVTYCAFDPFASMVLNSHFLHALSESNFINIDSALHKGDSFFCSRMVYLIDDICSVYGERATYT